MKKSFLILSALLLAGIGAWAQESTAYKFVCTDWGSIDTGRVTDDNVIPDETSNTITVNATGDNNVALSNGREVPYTTASYTVTNKQCWFIVVGTDISTESGASKLWWMNGANAGEWDPTLVETLSDGQVLVAWDLSNMSAIDVNLQNDVNNLDGWTGFGLTSTTGESVISNICFYTWDEAVEAYPELEGELAETTPYEFVCTDWGSIDTGRVTDDNVIPDETSNTITVKATGANNVALSNGREVPYTTASYTVTNKQCWFVVVGTNISTEESASKLWWMNGINWGEWDPTMTETLSDGQVFVAWDLSTMDEIDTNLHNDVNNLNGWTGFGLTSTTGESVISNINFYTWAEVVAAYPELDNSTPYVFVNTDWVVLSDNHADITTATATDNNTITVTTTANSTTSIGLTNGNGTPYTTANYTVTKEQCWFVVVGTNLSTGEGASELWWMNGDNDGLEWPQTQVVTLNDGQVLVAWDLSTIDDLDKDLQDAVNNLDGWTCFGLTSTTGESVISNINFYTWAEAVVAYPELAGEEAEVTPYEFVCTDWVASDNSRATADVISYDESANTVTVAATGANNVALGNHPSEIWGVEYFDDITTANMYITEDQCWFVIAGFDLATGGTDSYWWWMNGFNENTQVAPDCVVEHNGQQVFAWDISAHMGTADSEGRIMLDGGTCFGLTTTATSSTLSDINFYTWEAAVSNYPELNNDGTVHSCVATESHWSIDSSELEAYLSRNSTSTEQDASGMEVPYMQYYIWEGDETSGNIYLPAATISHTPLTGLATGYYEVSMDIRIIDYDADATVGEGTLFVANDASEDIKTGADANDSEYDGHEDLYGTYTLVCAVTDGTLNVSLVIPEDATYNWIAFKNLTVNYLGDTEVKWTLGASYGTMFLPFDYDLTADGLTAYTVTGLNSDGDTLVLSTEGLNSVEANTPYIISGDTEAQITHTFYGDAVEATSFTDGYLTGVVVDTYAPANSYVLQNQTGTPAFYLVESANSILVAAYHCYLDCTAGVKSVTIVFGDDMTTGIEAVESEAEAGSDVIYDLSGRRVSKAQKGVYIVNGKKVVIK